jgi:hypothetical protein
LNEADVRAGKPAILRIEDVEKIELKAPPPSERARIRHAAIARAVRAAKSRIDVLAIADELDEDPREIGIVLQTIKAAEAIAMERDRERLRTQIELARLEMTAFREEVAANAAAEQAADHARRRRAENLAEHSGPPNPQDVAGSPEWIAESMHLELIGLLRQGDTRRDLGAAVGAEEADRRVDEWCATHTAEIAEWREVGERRKTESGAKQSAKE